MTSKIALFISGCCLSVLLLACKDGAPKPPPVAPVTVKMEHLGYKKCIKDSLCAEVSVDYPVLSGGKPEAVKIINDSLTTYAKYCIYNNQQLSLATAVDSSGISMYAGMVEQSQPDMEYAMSYSNELKCVNLLQNSRYYSVAYSYYSFMGGAHGNYGNSLYTFDLNTGRQIQLTEIVADTNALRPLLEKAFVESKKEEGQPAPPLSDLLFPEFQKLPMPIEFAVTPEGLRFVYNTYEVAAYAFGMTDEVLTWAQLGALADKKKWVD